MSSRTCRILGIRGWYHYATMAPPGKPGFSHRRDVRSDHVAEAWQGYVNAVLYMTQFSRSLDDEREVERIAAYLAGHGLELL